MLKKIRNFYIVCVKVLVKNVKVLMKNSKVLVKCGKVSQTISKGFLKVLENKWDSNTSNSSVPPHLKVEKALLVMIGLKKAAARPRGIPPSG